MPEKESVPMIDLLDSVSTVERLHPTVLEFAKAMQFKLDKNKHKDGQGWERNPDGSRNGWTGCSLAFLTGKLREEVRELLEAIENGGPEEIRYEAADVGNIAMMIADVRGAFAQSTVPKWQGRDPNATGVVEVRRYIGREGQYAKTNRVLYEPVRVGKNGARHSLLEFMSEGYGRPTIGPVVRVAEKEAGELGWPLVYIDDVQDA